MNFDMPIRVYYADTDAGGIVYHATYLDMAERCRTEYLRHLDHPLVGAQGEQFVVRRAEIDWWHPARLDDLLTCTTRVTHLGGASLVMEQRFTLNDVALAQIVVTLVHVSATMRPVRIPATLRAAMSASGAA